MKHRIGGKINLADFKRLYYEQRLSNAEIANHFGCSVSAIPAFRKRYDLPVRKGRWGSGHPFKGKTHTDESRKKISKNRTGKAVREQNHNWKGGSHLTVYGYRRVWTDDGYKLEHRVVVEKFIGRSLKADEIVHHINHDKLDNRIENLCILSRSEHAKEHNPHGSYFGIHSITHN